MCYNGYRFAVEAVNKLAVSTNHHYYNKKRRDAVTLPKTDIVAETDKLSAILF